MIIVDCKQGESEWHDRKRGVPSSSNFDKICTSMGEPTKGKTRQDYLYRLAGERISGKSEPTYQNKTMQDGTEREPESRAYFELISGLAVQEVGLVYNNDKSALCSPDGLIDAKTIETPYTGMSKKQGLELKNPLAKTQIKYLLDNKLPTIYVCQVQGSMWITGFDSWWFMSYVPNMPELKILVKRDEKFIELLEKEVNQFIKDLDEIVKTLTIT
jgi:hypothetical protein